MIGMLVVLTLVIALALVAVGLLARWGVNAVQGSIAGKLRAAEAIVDDQRIPEEWLAPHRRAVARAQHRGSGTVELDKIGARIQQECLRRLDELIAVFKEGAFVDGDDARALLMGELRAARRRWAGARPRYFIDAANGFYDDPEPAMVDPR